MNYCFSSAENIVLRNLWCRANLNVPIEHWDSVYIIARVHADMLRVGVIDEGSKAPLDANTLFCISLLTQRLPGNDRSPEPEDQGPQRRRHVTCCLRKLLLSLCYCHVVARAQLTFKARTKRKPGKECVVEKGYFSLSFLFLFRTLCLACQVLGPVLILLFSRHSSIAFSRPLSSSLSFPLLPRASLSCAFSLLYPLRREWLVLTHHISS